MIQYCQQVVPLVDGVVNVKLVPVVRPDSYAMNGVGGAMQVGLSRIPLLSVIGKRKIRLLTVTLVVFTV